MLLRTPAYKGNVHSKSGQDGMDSKLYELEAIKVMCVDLIDLVTPKGEAPWLGCIK